LGQKAIEKFGAQEIYIDLTSVCDFITEEIPHLNAQIRKVLKTTKGQNSLNNWSWSEKISSGNIKARLRMMLGTYHVARMLGGMVLSTDNLSEYMMGFWTINGDVGDFGIIQHVFKGLELYDVARYLGVPKEIIAAKPDDGLGVAGGDEDQLGAAYPILDQVMIRQIQAGFDLNGGWEQMKTLKNIKGVPEKVVKRLCERALGTAYKRRGTITLNREDLGLPPIKKIKL
jgi:NAD+ synthetase